jgi:hypothetical protein
MLSKIDPKVTKELSKGLFDKFDLSGDGMFLKLNNIY